MTSSKVIQIISVPLDLGASRRGTDAGPSGFRIADLHAAIEQQDCKEPGGISYREAHLFMKDCALDGRMVSMDVVEPNPFLDRKNISEERAVRRVKNAFGSRTL